MKGYERTWAEVDLDALAHNMSEIRQKTDKKALVMAVVKADGYGHGAAEITPTLLENGAGLLSVATCDEAVALRKRGVGAPILLLGFTPPERFKDVAEYDLIQTVFSLDMAKELGSTATALGATVRVHVKVDTGMSRLGFMPCDNSVADIKAIDDIPGVNITGFYTHLAQSDGAEQSFTREQLEKLMSFKHMLENAGIKMSDRLWHAANSGAIIGCPDMALDMVRAGIMLYGLPPSPEADMTGWALKLALSWRTQVSYVKALPAGVSVGYSRTWYTKRDSVIATVPVGYADGYSRALSNKGKVLIRGRLAPIVGNVCMDQFMADVTDIPGVLAGDEVTLIGRQEWHGSAAGDIIAGEITADEMAAWRGTINYEVVCDISKRVPRVYIMDRKTVKKINLVL